MALVEFPRGYLVELRFWRTPSSGNPTLSLTLGPSLGATDDHREVVFEGVSDLQVSDLNTLAHITLVARDVREWQHQGVRFTVSDSEEEVLTFKCLRWR